MPRVPKQAHYIPTPLERRIVEWLEQDQQERSARDVAGEFGIDYDTALSALNKLDRKGLVKRVARWTVKAPHTKAYTHKPRPTSRRRHASALQDELERHAEAMRTLRAHDLVVPQDEQEPA